MATTAIQAQAGSPAKVLGRERFFSFSTGLGRGVWQRQQTSLSSGFQVWQFGQSMCAFVPFCRGSASGMVA